MYRMGYLTTVVYLISLTFYLFGFYNHNFLWGGVGLGTLFLVIGTAILAFMLGKEIKRGISWKFW